MQLIVKTVKGEQYSVECEAVRRPVPSARARVRVRVRQRLPRRPHGHPAPPRRPATPVRLSSVRHALQADSILAVKQKLAAQQSVAEPGLQKLLFSGCVLANTPSLGPSPNTNPDLFSGRVLANTNLNADPNPNPHPRPNPRPNPNPNPWTARRRPRAVVAPPQRRASRAERQVSSK